MVTRANTHGKFSIKLSSFIIYLIIKIMKTDLFSLASGIKLSPTSKAAKLIASGSKDEKALAKALLTTKAYKEDIEITAAVDIVLTGVIAKEQQESKKEDQTSTSSRSGEPCRRGY